MPHCWKSHVTAQFKSLWYPIGTSVQESKLAGLFYFLILRATTIYWNTFVTFHKVFCARCGTNCIDSWYLPFSLLFILTRVPTHKKYRILCYPLRSYSGWLPIRCAYFILNLIEILIKEFLTLINLVIIHLFFKITVEPSWWYMYLQCGFLKLNWANAH